MAAEASQRASSIDVLGEFEATLSANRVASWPLAPPNFHGALPGSLFAQQLSPSQPLSFPSPPVPVVTDRKQPTESTFMEQ